MKRASIVVTVILGIASSLALLALTPSRAEAQYYPSEPVLMGGDHAGSVPAESRASHATHLRFFKHPASTPGSTNFSAPTQITLPGFSDLRVGDMTAVPGFPGEAPIGPTAVMLDDLQPHVALPGISFDPQGIGPDDYLYEESGVLHTYGIDYRLSSTDNYESFRLLMGDLRMDNALPDNEFTTLFGADPLEEGLIGNASEVSPYTVAAAARYYPAAVTGFRPGAGTFRFCAIANDKWPVTGYACAPALQFGREYTDAFFYDVADIGTGLVSASYDPVTLRVTGIGHEKIGAAAPTAALLNSGNPFDVAYMSPLTFFRRVGLAGTRYRFTGYLAWDYTRNFVPAKTFDFWNFGLSNWMLPIATNPVAVEAIDLVGASSWQECSAGPCAPTANTIPVPGYPDTDLAAVYQTTVYNLDQWMTDKWGRPTIIYDENETTRHLREYELIGTCDTSACGTFTPLDSTLFQSRVASLALFWKQQRQWLTSVSATGDYENMNPGHVFELAAGALVGPGMFDAAVLTDFPASPDPDVRHQVLVVPSGCAESGVECPGGNPRLFVVDVKDGKKLYLKKIVSQPLATPSCDRNAEYEETPFVLAESLPLTRPIDGVVPYQIRSGQLGTDACGDAVITWRGEKTISVAAGQPDVRFSNGGSPDKRFARTITIANRTAASSTTCNDMPTLTLLNIPCEDLERCEIGAVALGDYDDDGNTDIALGNALPEQDADDGSKFTAYAYVLLGDGSGTYSTMPDRMTRVRMGFLSDASEANATGVSMLAADATTPDADALGAVNSEPFALPDIGCPDYTSADDPTVGSIYEMHQAVRADIWGPVHAAVMNPDPASFPPVLDLNPPYLTTGNRPQPIRCQELTRCVVTIGADASFQLPFSTIDPCCENDCPRELTMFGRTCENYLLHYQPLTGLEPPGNDAECAFKAYIDKYKECLTEHGGPFPAAKYSSYSSALEQQRPDEVVASNNGHAIARADELRPATDPIQQYKPLYDFETINPGYELAVPKCNNDGTKDAFEDCDTGTTYPLGGGGDCTATQICVDCECISVPQWDDVKLPHGFLPGLALDKPRETTAVLLKMPVCGNDTIEPGEECEPPSTATCDAFCQDIVTIPASFCGDGDVDVGETCGEPTLPACPSGETCVACACVPGPASGCGDGDVDAGETCGEPTLPACVAPLTCTGCICTGCGNSIVEAGETCDPPDGVTCDATCQIIPGPACGNGALDPGEPCDGLLGACPAGESCVGCTCIPGVSIGCGNSIVEAGEDCDPPGLSPTCDCDITCHCTTPGSPVCGDGVKDPGEECDLGMAPLTQAQKIALLNPAQCGPPDPVLGIATDCSMAGCTCVRDCNLDPAATCHSDADCNASEYCSSTCDCHALTNVGPGPDTIPAVTEVLPLVVNDCFVHADTFSSEKAAEENLKANEAYRAVSGRPDDLVVEVEQGATIVCRVAGGSAIGTPAASIPTLLSGSPIPGTPDNLRPFAFIQTRGSRFIDMSRLEFTGFERLAAPERLFPAEAPAGDTVAAQKLKAAILPQLSSGIVGAAPLAATSLAVSPDGAVNINNMVTHRVLSFDPGSSYLMPVGPGKAQQVMALATELPKGSSIAVHEFRFRINPDYASWTAPEGYAGAPNIEDRQLKPEPLFDQIRSRLNEIQSADGKPTSAIAADLSSYDEHLNYNFTLSQAVFGPPGSPELSPVELKVAMIAKLPGDAGVGGGGCGCHVAGATSTAQSALPWLIALVVPALGIAVRRMRRK